MTVYPSTVLKRMEDMPGKISIRINILSLKLQKWTYRSSIWQLNLAMALLLFRNCWRPEMGLKQERLYKGSL